MSSSPNQNQSVQPEEELKLFGIIPLSKRVSQQSFPRISEDLPTKDEAKLLIKKLNLPTS